MPIDNDNISDEPEMITDVDLQGVTGGRRTTPTAVTGKLSNNDTIVGLAGVNNDTIISSFSADATVKDGLKPTLRKK